MIRPFHLLRSLTDASNQAEREAYALQELAAALLARQQIVDWVPDGEKTIQVSIDAWGAPLAVVSSLEELATQLSMQRVEEAKARALAEADVEIERTRRQLLEVQCVV